MSDNGWRGDEQDIPTQSYNLGLAQRAENARKRLFDFLTGGENRRYSDSGNQYSTQGYERNRREQTAAHQRREMDLARYAERERTGYKIFAAAVVSEWIDFGSEFWNFNTDGRWETLSIGIWLDQLRFNPGSIKIGGFYDPKVHLYGIGNVGNVVITGVSLDYTIRDAQNHPDRIINAHEGTKLQESVFEALTASGFRIN